MNKYSIPKKVIYDVGVYLNQIQEYYSDVSSIRITDENFILYSSGLLSDSDLKIIIDIVPKQKPLDTLVVSPRQIRLALIMAGFSLTTISDFISSLDEPNKSLAQISWEYATEIRRDDPLLTSFAPRVGLNESQLDDLFNLALGI